MCMHAFCVNLSRVGDLRLGNRQQAMPLKQDYTTFFWLRLSNIIRVCCRRIVDDPFQRPDFQIETRHSFSKLNAVLLNRDGQPQDMSFCVSFLPLRVRY